MVVRSAHYDFSSAGERGEAEDLSRMLEAAWPHYSTFFGAEPTLRGEARLHVALFEDDATWRAAIVAGGGSAPDSGGYYCPAARTAYLKRQPSAWYTRTLLLHEAAHQFHYLACTGNDTPTGNWYVEGVAEHLGSHTWDGETLHVGVTPLLSLEDRSGKALTEVAAADFSLAELIDAPSASRPVAMFLVRYLAETQAKKFGALRKKLDRGTGFDAKQFARAVGKPERFLPAWREWLATVQEPLQSVYLEWDARGPAELHGTAGVVSVCRTREPARSISAHISRRGERRFRAGLLLAITNPRDYVVALVDDSGETSRLFVDRQRDGRWTRLVQADLGVAGNGEWDATATHAGEGVLLTLCGVDGETREFTIDALPEGSLGLAIDSCSAAFTSLRID